MKHSTLVASGLLATLAAAAPLATRQATNIDTTVLQFALTLEHLENVFYKDALKKFSQGDFAKAGYDATFYDNLKYITSDEESHVKLLSAALTGAGVTPNAACTYSFPYTDVDSFVTLSSIIEGVGTSAYLGGAPLITSKDYLTVAGSILVTEALHTSYQRASVGEVPFPTPYGTPLDPTSVFTLASAFIVKCPDSNAALPFTPYPALTYNAPSTKYKREWDDWNYDADHKDPAKTDGKYDDKKDGKYDDKKDGKYDDKKDGKYDDKKDGKNDLRSDDDNSWEGWSDANKDCDSYDGGKGYGGNGHQVGHGPAAPPPASGSTAKFTTKAAVPAGSFLTFISGLTVVSVPGTISGSDISAAIPATVGGQTYVFITSADVSGKFDGSKVVAGPAIVEIAALPQSIDYSYIKN